MITRDEALMILSKFHSEKLPLACVGEFFGWTLAFRGKVSALTRAEFSIASLDGVTILRFGLDREGLVFEYWEPKSLGSVMDVPELSQDAATVGIGFPLRLTVTEFAELGTDRPNNPETGPRREKLFLMELRE